MHAKPDKVKSKPPAKPGPFEPKKMKVRLDNRNRMLRERRFASACHEACHAVVSIFLVGQTFHSIRLGKEKREVPAYLRAFGVEVEVTSQGQFIPTEGLPFRCDALNEAKVFLAGIAFEKLLRPHRTMAFHCVYGSAMGDYQDAMKWCRYAWYLDEADEANQNSCERLMFKILYPLVRDVLIRKWADVVKVGEMLEQRGELSYEEVSAIVGFSPARTSGHVKSNHRRHGQALPADLPAQPKPRRARPAIRNRKPRHPRQPSARNNLPAV